MQLQTELAQYSQKVSQRMVLFFSQRKKRATALAPSMLQSATLLEEFCMRGGKAIRPFLVKVGYEIAGGTNEQRESLLTAASSVELHHKHLLIYDDIWDQDEKRYGGLTLEWMYRDIFTIQKNSKHMARSFAMFDAAWLGALSKELLLESTFNPQILLSVIHILDTTMFEDTLAGEQILGIECLQKISESTVDEFVHGLELVTARYTFEGPLLIGMRLANSTDKKLEHALTVYANSVGIAFQIQDDILGLYGDTQKTGKPVGNDVREGKKTLLIQKAYESANANERQFLESVVGKQSLSHQEIAQVQDLVKRTQSLQYSQDAALKMVKRGIEVLEHIPSSKEKELLIELAYYCVQREK